MRRIGVLLVAALALAGCGGDDDAAPATTVAVASAEACHAALQVYDIAIQAWHAQYGDSKKADVEQLVADGFIEDHGTLSDDALADLVVIVNGQAQSGPACS